MTPSKIIWTKVDEAPALATYDLLPVVRAFTRGTGIDVETRDISFAGRIIASFPENLTEGQRVPDDLTALGRLCQTPEANVIRHVKNVSAHKTDVLDCQWLQQLGTFGLLKSAFRPADAILPLRAYLRQRDMLIKSASTHVQHMQKALTQMNLQLHNVISDITGATGMGIIRNIVAGIIDPKILATYRDGRCHNSEEVIEASLIGNYRKEHLFRLKQALELYDHYIQKVAECDHQIAETAKTLEAKGDVKRSINSKKPLELQRQRNLKNTNTLLMLLLNLDAPGPRRRAHPVADHD